MRGRRRAEVATPTPAALAPERLAGTSPKVLRDYALVADGHRGALVGSEGELAWLCFPGWADPAVFAGLLGGRGCYQLRPRGRALAEGRYEDGTLVWANHWMGERGTLDARSAFALPATPRRAVLLRRLTARGAPAVVDLVLDVASDYGRSRAGEWRRTDVGPWVLDGPALHARLAGVPEAVAVPTPGGGAHLVAVLELDAGEERDLVLELSVDPLDGTTTPDAASAWRATLAAWEGAVPACDDTIAARDARRACAVLRGMTTPEGATIAAVTTSLPEHDESGRNYDYRFAWLRDTCYVGHAGASVAGGEPILDDAVRWVAERLLQDGPTTMPAYLPDGRPVPRSEDLGLPGYPGGRDVVGNRVRDQFQLDVFGEALCLLARAASRDRLAEDGWKAAQVAVETIAQRHDEPDAGIWEIEPNRWTQSRLLCVAGLRGIAAAPGAGPLASSAPPLADALLEGVSRTCVHPTGRWQRAADDPRVDASLLLAAVRGATPPGDPRATATREAVSRELSDDGYVYRYTADGEALGEAEGAFLICSFWMTLACLGERRHVEAARWFERARGSCGSPGLFSEEYDVEHHQLRGNLPQTFVHALLVESGANTAWEGA